MVITQAGLGLRIGELVALRIQDVDFLRRTVRIEWQTDPTGKHRMPPKTPRSRRTLPLPAVVADVLAAHIAEFPPAADGSLFTGSTANRGGTSTTAPGSLRRRCAGLACRLARRATISGITTLRCCSPLVNRGWLWRSPWAMRTRPWCLPRTGICCLTGSTRTRRAVDDAWISDGPGTDGGDHPQTSFLVSN
jgi:hypothetical protein